MINNNVVILSTAIAIGGNSVLTAANKPFVVNVDNDKNIKKEVVQEVKNPKNLLAYKTVKDLCKEIEEKQLKEEQERKAREIRQKEIELMKKDNNRMDTVGINSNNLTVISNIKEDEFNKVFDLMNQPQMKKLSKAFIDAEKKYKVNALFLAGIVAQESLWSKKPAGDGTNLTGYCVYTKDAKGETFNSYYSNIMATAKLLSEHYLNPKGKYYNGKSMIAVNELYCKYQDQVTTDYRWSESIYKISNDFEQVYQNKVKKHHEI